MTMEELLVWNFIFSWEEEQIWESYYFSALHSHKQFYHSIKIQQKI